jgi:IAA-amino acid hydrolase
MQVVSVTTMDGGNNLDMIPETVVLGGTFRAYSNTSFYQLLQRIKEVCSDSHFIIRFMY